MEYDRKYLLLRLLLLYLLVVTRVCGAQLAGFYSLSYATAQLLLQVGRYGVRTYQATDLEHKYIFPSIRFPALSPVH